MDTTRSEQVPRNPERWSRTTRDWSLPKEVWLNRPAEESALRQAA